MMGPEEYILIGSLIVNGYLYWRKVRFDDRMLQTADDVAFIAGAVENGQLPLVHVQEAQIQAPPQARMIHGGVRGYPTADQNAQKQLVAARQRQHAVKTVTPYEEPCEFCNDYCDGGCEQSFDPYDATMQDGEIYEMTPTGRKPLNQAAARATRKQKTRR